MNIILVAINAKYIHSSLAAYSLYAYLSEEEKKHVQIQEFTVNQSEELIFSEILRQKPDALAFSCYIWNIDMVMSLIESFKKILPDMPIIVGGPEASYEYEGLLSIGADVVVQGEGEEPFRELVRELMGVRPSRPQFCHSGLDPESSCSGLLTRSTTVNTNETCPMGFNLKIADQVRNDKPQNKLHDKPQNKLHNIVKTPPSPPAPLANIPFPYPPEKFPTLANRIIYYETSRGCVNRCGYCLSSATEGVRFLTTERVQSDLNKFLQARVKQVKFVDRTFNCNKAHAIAIWSHLIQNDNGITNFHFEIAGELLDDETLHLLGKARKGLFQFEIGVQSTNPKTHEAIRRTTDTAKLFENVRKLKEIDNIHLHLDLIVGLPHEDYASFKQSFNDVFACYPHKLQVGFLKLLKGSQLRKDAAKYGIIYKKNAPYGVLQTNDITFEQVNHLKKIEHMVDTFYGATSFDSAVFFMIQNFASPFDFFDALAAFWEENDYHLVSHKKIAMYSILHKFALKFLPEKIRTICEKLKFDMLLQENIRTFPDWINEYYQCDNKLITRNSAVHTFEDGQTLHFDYTLPIDNGRCTVYNHAPII